MIITSTTDLVSVEIWMTANLLFRNFPDIQWDPDNNKLNVIESGQ